MNDMNDQAKAELAGVLTRMRSARLYLTRPDIAICRSHVYVPIARPSLDPQAANHAIASAKIPYKTVPELAGLDTAIETLTRLLEPEIEQPIAAS